MPGSFGSLAVVLIAASSFEAVVGAEGEVAVGRAPIEVAGPEEESVALTLVPGAGLRLSSAQSTLWATYTPRIFYRLPNALDVSRPLVLHQAAIGHDLTPSRFVVWTTSAEVNFGQLDYTSASVVFAAGSRPVQTSVAEVLRVDGQSGLAVALTRDTTWMLDVTGQYTTSPDDVVVSDVVVDGTLVDEDVDLPGADEDPEAAPEFVDALPSSAGLSATNTLLHALNRRDAVGVAAQVAYQWFADTGEFLLWSPELSYVRSWANDGQLTLVGGLAYVQALESGQESSLGGTGGIELASQLYTRSGVVASGSLGASVEWFFDPIAGTSQPRVGVELGTDVTVGRRWQLLPNAAFFAILRSGDDPDLEVEGALVDAPDATTLQAEVPIRFRLSEEASFNFGVRAALRGRALGAEGFSLTEQMELWGFFGLTVRASTRAGDTSWLGF